MDPILDDHGLAQLLKAPDKTLAAILERTDLPRFFIDGSPRFLTSAVLEWLASIQHGAELLPPAVEEVVAVEPPPADVDGAKEAAAPRTMSPRAIPASAHGTPWLQAEALDGLASGAGDPGRNLDRLKLRDALLELNDALLPILGRLSGGRLHPHHDEKMRTSPWRLDFDAAHRIEAIGIAWGAGEHAPPGFTDRPHVEVELKRDTLCVRLDSHGRRYAPPLESGLMAELEADGFAPIEGAGESPGFQKTYLLPEPSPSLEAVAHCLEQDLRRLVPLWTRLV
jgi:hypothetical protein